MSEDHDLPRQRLGGLDPQDLDGHSIDELTDYLEAGRTPRNPSIEESASCQLALDALERLHGLGPALIAADAEASRLVDDSWVDRVLGEIALDVRAGRRVPLPSSDPRSDLGITEGALRGMIRGAEKSFPGVVLGRCRIDGDVLDADAPISIDIEASVPYGTAILRLVEEVRAEIAARLAAHTALNIERIDVTVENVLIFDEDLEQAAGGDDDVR